jgi:tellurite resistance protein TerB
MPYRRALSRFSKRSWDDFIKDFRDVHDQGVMEGVTAGCAVVAYADGWVTDEERRRMLGLLRGFEGVDNFHLSEVEHQFDEITSWFEQDHEEGERRALALVEKLRGRGREAELLVQACCAIAAADGGFDAEERQAAQRICTVLELDPAKFDLADARTAPAASARL